MKLRDKFWLWGHPEGRYNNEYGNTQISRMTPMEAFTEYGITKLATRISELKKQGYHFTSVMVEQKNRYGEPVRFMQYWRAE